MKVANDILERNFSMRQRSNSNLMHARQELSKLWVAGQVYSEDHRVEKISKKRNKLRIYVCSDGYTNCNILLVGKVPQQECKRRKVLNSVTLSRRLLQGSRY